MPAYEVNGKVALITGGARGIGFAIGSALAHRGASIVLVDVDGADVEEAAERLGARAIGIAADVTDTPAIENAVSAAAERFGGLDIVVANAGIAPSAAPVRLMPPAEFERVIEVNLLGVYRTVHAALDQVVARQGQAVLVSSVLAFVNGLLISPYAVAKAGVEQLGRALRLELAAHGASATVAYFGFVDTEMVRRGFEERERVLGSDEGPIPEFLRKPITPEQAAEAVAAAIARRRPRVIAPRWWAAASALRGVLGPAMDAAGVRSSRLQDEVRQTEAVRSREAAEQPPRLFGPS